MNFINVELLDVFRIKQHLSVPKIMEISSGVLKMQAEDVSLQA